MIGILSTVGAAVFIAWKVLEYYFWLKQSCGVKFDKTVKFKWNDFKQIYAVNPNRILFEETTYYDRHSMREIKDNFPIILYNPKEERRLSNMVQIKLSFFGFYQYIRWLKQRDKNNKKAKKNADLRFVLEVVQSDINKLKEEARSQIAEANSMMRKVVDNNDKNFKAR